MYQDILSNLIITKIRSVSTIYTEKNTRAERVSRPCWGIIIKYEGETRYENDGKTFVSNRNNMVILPKGSSYRWCCTKSGHYSVIEFESELEYDSILGFSVKNTDKILEIFKELEYKRTVKKPMYELECIRDTYAVLLMLANSAKYLPSEKLEKIAPALDYIAKNYNTPVRNEELAEIAGLSTVYFRKLFAEVMGSSPIAYVHALRIKKAKEMLKSDYGSITDIAQSLGYPNIYDFSRAFKKYTGVSPTKY